MNVSKQKIHVLGIRTGPSTKHVLFETWRGMEESLEQGLCRHIGVSNFSQKKLQALLQEARIKPEMNQIELHPYLQQKELIDYCKSNGLQVTGYSPLGSSDRPEGLKHADDPILLENEVILKIAAAHQCVVS